jgi:hypothetical protein
MSLLSPNQISDEMKATFQNAVKQKLLASDVTVFYCDSTTGYNLKLLAGNRPINQKHVHNLMTKISSNNLLAKCPGLVTLHGEILDGQHRYMAACKLKKRFYFTLHPNISSDALADAQALNACQKNGL